MAKRKIKKQLKQKQKQNVKVSQNVKVIIGDKRKQVKKAAGKKSGASAKPPIVLNISNPQPLNNPYMEYFKQQLQNQTPIKGNTLQQNEILNEREENKASKAGTLHRLDQEPNDVARELRAKAAEQRVNIARAEEERKRQVNEMSASLKKFKTPKPPRRQTKLVLKSSEDSMLSELEQQRNQMEQAINTLAPEAEDSGVSGGGEESDVPETPVPAYLPPLNPLPEKPKSVRRRGRKPLTQEQIETRRKEEETMRREKLQMFAEDKVQKRRGRKMLPQEEIDRRRRQRELDKTFEKIFAVNGDTEGDY